MAIKPPKIPMLTLSDAARLLKDNKVTDQVALLGVRGYYRNSMGIKGKNDIGIYDDAIFLVSPSAYMACNANTDPSVQYQHIALLEPGLWRYKIGTHGLNKPVAQRYKALVQAKEVTVGRFHEGLDTGFFGINIHRGSYTKTSSLGCQTIWPDQWPSFISLVESQLRLYKQKTVPYLLLENEGDIA